MVKVQNLAILLILLILLVPWNLVFLAPSAAASSTKRALNHHVVLTGKTMGTTYSVQYVAAKKTPTEAVVQKAIDSLLEGVNQAMSTYIKESEISRFNATAANRAMAISADFGFVLNDALRLAEKTDGFFEPTIRPLINLYRFGAVENEKNDKRKKGPTADEISKTLARIGYKHIQLQKRVSGKWRLSKKKEGVEIDLSAIAKGFGVDKVHDYLADVGVKSSLTEIGGELRAVGVKFDGQQWTVGVERPDQLTRTPMLKVPLVNSAIATSGNYRNFRMVDGKRVGHVMNPKDGKFQASKLASVSVIAETAMAADGWATALLSMGDKRARAFAKKHKVAAVFVVMDNNHLKTEKTDAYRVYEQKSKQQSE